MAAVDPCGQQRDPAAVFVDYLERSVTWSLGKIEQAQGAVPAAELSQALHVLSFALQVDQVWSAAARLALALAPRMERDGYREELRAVLESALRRSQETADATTEARLRWHLGVLHHRQAEYGEAGAQLERSARLFANLHAPREQARALNRLAFTAFAQRRLVEAEQLVERAGRLLDGGDPEQAYGLLVLGSVALARRHWHRARICFTQMFCFLTDAGDLRMLAWASVNLGVAYVQLERYQEARAWYLRGIDLFRFVGDPVHRAVAQMNLGVVYAMTGQPAEALALYAQAEPVFHKAADTRRRAMVYNNIGYAYGLQGRWAAAEPAYRQAVQHHREAGNIAGMIETMDSLAQSLERQGQADEAAEVVQAALAELERLEPDSGKQHYRQTLTSHLAKLQAQSQGAAVRVQPQTSD